MIRPAPFEKIQYGGKLDYGGQVDYGVNSKYPIPQELAEEVFNDIQFPLHWLDVPIFLFPYRLMVYQNGLFTGLEYNGRAYSSHIVYGARNQTPTKEDIGALIIHEIGHMLCYKFVDPDFADKQFTPKMQEYLKLRGIEDWTDNEDWEYRPSEIFAEDFRCLFGLPYMTVEEFLPYKHIPFPSEQIREWMLSLIPIFENKEVNPLRKDVKIYINKPYIDAGNMRIPADVPAKIINDRTMLPVRAVATAMSKLIGKDIVIDWNPYNGDGQVTLSVDDDEPPSTRTTLDAGHGGSDPGAIGQNGTYEKDINLKMALGVGELINPYTQAHYTRTDDLALGGTITQDLSNRAYLANKNQSNLFVSIHCNSATDRTAHGFEIYCYKKGGEAEKLAQSIHDRCNDYLCLTDRGIKEGNFAVLRDTNMPAVLIELAFISNPTEEGLLNDAEFITKAQRAISDGIKEYLGV